MFVWPHKLILKTCGTTTLLLGIPTLLRIASETCGFKGVWRCFYSRKTFMFPDRQRGPHKDWNAEMAFLDKLFGTLRRRRRRRVRYATGGRVFRSVGSDFSFWRANKQKTARRTRSDG